MKTCFWEETSILWNGSLTPSVSKGKGVKQGCPLSPRLFTILLNSAMSTLAETFHLDLNYRDGISMPLILAYADDVVFVSNIKNHLSMLLNEVIDLFASLGLTLNVNKTEVLIRDPEDVCREPDDLVTVGNLEIKRVHELKYLGEYQLSERFINNCQLVFKRFDCKFNSFTT